MIPASGRWAPVMAVLLAGFTTTMAMGPAVVWPAGRAGAQALRLGTVAPEIAGAPWINGGPLTTAGLRGRVVLVEFWTYG